MPNKFARLNFSIVNTKLLIFDDFVIGYFCTLLQNNNEENNNAAVLYRTCERI